MSATLTSAKHSTAFFVFFAVGLCVMYTAHTFNFFIPTAEATGETVIFLTSGTSWTVPADWNSSNNTIEVIGGGGGGGSSGARSGGGGGGYSKISNVSFATGSVIGYAAGGGGGSGGSGGDTYFCNSTSNCTSISGATVVVGAKGGGGGVSIGSSGAGGSASAGVGTIRYFGGNGTAGLTAGGGGGGAAGPNGDGGNGGISSSGAGGTGGTGGGGANGGSAGANVGNQQNGGRGGDGRSGTGGGAGGTPGVSNCPGGSGTAGTGGGGGGSHLCNGVVVANGGQGAQDNVWTQTSDGAVAGPGGGGGGGAGGAGRSPGQYGGPGGGYGGGGGGAGGGGPGSRSGASGRPGIIIITYTPFVATIPDAPTSLDAAGGIEQISLTWVAPSSNGGSAITNYKIYRSTSPTPTTPYQTLGNVLNYTDSAVTVGTTYYYRVKATNAVGDSAYSNEDSAVATSACPTGPNGGNISGWAWSDTIGWISLNSGDAGTCASSAYGLTLSGGTITGYAWSENVGWIQFGGLSGFPSGTGTIASNATVSGNNVVGWARAMSYSDSQAGGWDGWISLSGTGYGLTLVDDTQIIGWAWGDTNLGWISFSANYACAGTYGYYCSANVKHYRDLSCGVDTISGVPETCSYLCSSGACVPPPDPIGTLGGGLAIIATPTLVRSGGTVTVEWGTQDTTSCSVTENNSSITDSWTGTSGTQTSSPINTTTTYTLDCDSGALVRSATVRTTPTFREF